jgi:hypothetical protein
MGGDMGMTELEPLPRPPVGGLGQPDELNPFLREPSGYGNPNALIHREQFGNRPVANRSARESAEARRYSDLQQLDAMLRRLQKASGDFDY